MELEKLTAEDLQAIVQRNGKGYSVLSQQETSDIAKALLNYSIVCNEKIPEQVIKTWIEEFKKMGLSIQEILRVIDKAKYIKKFGNTSFDTFVEVLKDEGFIYTKAELQKLSLDRALAIYETEYKGLLDKLERERTANEETRLSIEQVNKFFADIQERHRQVSEEINKVLDTVKRKCAEKFDNFGMFTLNKILDGERKKV